MANQTFPAFTAARSNIGALNATDEILIVRSGVTYVTTPDDLDTYIGGGGGGGFTERATAKVTTPISLTSASATFLTFDTETTDTASMIDLGSQPTRITIPADGEYDLNVWGYFAANATGVRIAAIYLGGVALQANDTRNAVAAGVHSFNITLNNVFFNTGNYLQVQGYQNSGGALNLSVCVFNVKRVA